MQAQVRESQIYFALLLAMAAAIVSTSKTYDLSPAAGRVFLPMAAYEVTAMAVATDQGNASGIDP